MSDKVISICCITYNQIQYIETAIQSFLIQKVNSPIEILIQDDNSNDGTWEVIKDYQSRYPKIIRGYQNEHNRYQNSEDILFNIMSKAKGEYIAVCEGDDYWIDKNKLQIQLDYMNKNAECTFLCSGAIYVNHFGESKSEFKEVSEDKVFTIRDLLRKSWCFPTASYFFPRKCLENVMPFYFKALPVEDIPLQLLCTMDGYGYFMNKNLCAYRQNSVGSWNNTVKKIKEKRIMHHKNMISMYHEFDKNTNNCFSKEVNEAIHIEEFNIVLCKEEYSSLNNPSFKKYIENLNFVTRMRISFAARFPITYTYLRTYYKKLQRK